MDQVFFNKRIESANNDKIKFIKKLLTSKKFREKNDMFVVEGLRLCYDAVLSKAEILMTFYTKAAYEKNRERLSFIVNAAKDSFLISESVVSKISDTENPQGIFCVVRRLRNKKNFVFDFTSKILVLENLQNPANVGTILRSADALGIKDVIVSTGCTDVYSPKVLRGSMGAVFRIGVWFTDDIVLWIKKFSKANITSYATVTDKDAEKITDVDFSHGTVIVVGNEANGISEEVLKACDKKITIPMKGVAESFNVAVAASIAMWEMMK